MYPLLTQHCVCDVELMKYIQDFRKQGLNYKDKIFVILFPTAFGILWLDIFFKDETNSIFDEWKLLIKHFTCIIASFYCKVRHLF